MLALLNAVKMTKESAGPNGAVATKYIDAPMLFDLSCGFKVICHSLSLFQNRNIVQAITSGTSTTPTYTTDTALTTTTTLSRLQYVQLST